MFTSLISRIILLIIFLLIIGVGGFTLFHLQREQVHLLESTRQSAELLLDTIEKSIFHSMRLGNSAEVQAILEMVGGSDGLDGVRIFGPDGLVLKSNHPDEIGQRVDKRTFNLYVQQQEEVIFEDPSGAQLMSLVRPIVADERCVRCHGSADQVVGVLSLDFSLAQLSRQLRETSEMFALSTVFILLFLAPAIALLLIRLLRQPLQRITDCMRQVEDGDLSVRMAPRGDDEVGRLMDGFNSMVGHLDRTRNELKQYHYRQMERADRLASVGEMAAGLAHEIKNPLAGICGAIDVLADDYPEDDQRREVMRQIQIQVGRLDKTVNDLLYFGKPGQPEFSYCDMNSLIKQTLMFVAQHPQAKNIKQVEELTRGLAPVWVDQKQIQQVLLNLLVNALQAMPDGGVLTVLTESLDCDGQDWLRVAVCDTGSGISAEELDKIFTPFYTTKTQGTGLGLPICRQLMESNGGALRAAGRPGQGARFCLELPTVKAPQGSQSEAPLEGGQYLIEESSRAKKQNSGC